MVKKWLHILIKKSDHFPQTTRMPVIYDTREKIYRFNPLGVLFGLYQSAEPEKYSVSIVKEEGRALNGGYKMCKMRMSYDRAIYNKEGEFKKYMETEEVTVTTLPRSILDDIGIKGEIAIYYDRLSEVNQKALLQKIEDISQMMALGDELSLQGVTKEHYQALNNVRAVFGYSKRSFNVSDLIILPTVNFKLVGKLIKLAGDSSIGEHDAKYDIEQLLKDKAAELAQPKKRRAKTRDANA